MTVIIDPKKKKITLKGHGSDRKILTIVAGFAGEAILDDEKGLLNKLTRGYVDRLTIDMTHENVSKEFIQLLMRMV